MAISFKIDFLCVTVEIHTYMYVYKRFYYEPFNFFAPFTFKVTSFIELSTSGTVGGCHTVCMEWILHTHIIDITEGTWKISEQW